MCCTIASEIGDISRFATLTTLIPPACARASTNRGRATDQAVPAVLGSLL